MLAAMGYKPGQSVGLRNGGLVEPIQIPDIKRGLWPPLFFFDLDNAYNCVEKTGLGAEDTEARKKRERQEVEAITATKRTKIESEYKHNIKSRFEEKKVAGRLVECIKVCRQLDETKGVQQNELLKEFNEAEARKVEEGQLPLTLYGYITTEMTSDDVRSFLFID